jgi:hypothetical protein
MRRIGSVLAALGLLLTAACHKPELISSEQLARPHVVSIIETDPKIIMDPGQPAPSFNSGAMAGGGGGGLVGVAVGALVVGAAQGFETARAGARQSRAQTLEEQLGSTSEIGTELQREFRSALTAEIARGTRMPIQRVENRPRGRAGQAPAAGEETLQLQFGTLLTQDARSVTVQVLVQQMVWKPEAERRPRESPVVISNQFDLVAFSQPIEAASPEIAIGLWRDNNYARLRQATRALMPEIMTLLRMAVLDQQPMDFANSPRVRSKLPGFSLVSHGRSSILYRGSRTPAQTNFQPSVSGHVVLRTPSREYMVMETVPDRSWVPSDGWIVKPDWAWVSVPAGAL